MECRVLSILLLSFCLFLLAPAAWTLDLPRPLSVRADFLESPYPRQALPPWLAPDTSTWWQQGLDWWLRWRRPSEDLEQVIVTPILPDGSHASPATLWLPPSQLRLEQGLQPRHTGASSLSSNATSSDGNQEDAAAKSNTWLWPWPWPPRKKKKPVPWYSYNSSAAAPLVPTSISWMADSQEMDGRAWNGSLDVDVARGLSRLVAAAYCNTSSLFSWNCTRCEVGFTPRRVIFDPLWDLQGFVGWSDTLNAIVIAFRGTDSHSYYNWVENMRTWRTDLALSYDGIPPKALVHGGFFYSYNSSYLAANISAAVEEMVKERTAHPSGADGGGSGGYWWVPLPFENTGSSTSSSNNRKLSGSRSGGLNMDFSSENGSPIEDNGTKPRTNANANAPTVFVTGHSLGGALATLCALDLRISLGLPDVRVVSFGSPRVGNYIFAKWFEEEIGPHWRFTHNRDIVPSVPPGYMGFYHVAQEVWVVDLLAGRTLVGVCDGSGEDPRCHNSVCHLGLCSSVADHLMYLSEMYTPHPHGC